MGTEKIGMLSTEQTQQRHSGIFFLSLIKIPSKTYAVTN